MCMRRGKRVAEMRDLTLALPLQELTEASFAGAAFSVCAAIFMILLVFAEFSSYLSVTTESKVVLDHFESSVDDTLQVNTF